MKNFITILAIVIAFHVSGQKRVKNMESYQGDKMKIEIWSDVVCPWCYIGKRRFEEALAQFPDSHYVEVIYKSYQLDPEMETDTALTVTQYLSDRKGIPVERAEHMAENVTAVAESVGLEYHLHKSIPINTLKAHGLLHYAITQGKQLQLKERLLKGYFTESLNLDDTDVLVGLATEVGLSADESRDVLDNNSFGKEVRQDIQEAVQLGLRGVPFFVFDRKYGVSGAQEADAFLKTLEKSYADWRKDNPIQSLEMMDGKICKPDGTCE